ncbi:ribbon-helix-helix domain-containing protein [Myxosarcina sp. GI1(2024)]
MPQKHHSAIVKFSIPIELLELIDRAAASRYQTRSEYCRNTLVKRLINLESPTIDKLNHA